MQTCAVDSQRPLPASSFWNSLSCKKQHKSVQRDWRDLSERERVAKGQWKCANPFPSCLMGMLVRLANQRWPPWYTTSTHSHTHAYRLPWVLSVKACLLIQPYRGFLKAQTSIWYTSIQDKQRKCTACYGFSLICAFCRVKIVKIIFKPFYFCI